MVDVIAGNAQIAIGTIVQMLPLIKSGKLRGLATGGRKRNAALADLPTVDEAGVKGYEGANWWGIMLPAGTSKAIVDRLDREIKAVLEGADVQKQFSTMGADADYMPQGEFARFIADETAKWTKVARQAGIQAQ